MSIKIGDNTIGGSPVVENSTGNSYTKTMSQASITNELETKADKNLVNTGCITNCITEIPQDIKLELNDGTLTLKSGSKVYVPNGFEQDGTKLHFDIITLTSDVSLSSGGAAGDKLVFYNWATNTIGTFLRENAYSGTTGPSTTGIYQVFYNTTDNKIYTAVNKDNNWVWTSKCALPLGLIESDGTNIISLKQVFNGFGYIASTLFVLPGIKGLIPNGRNADGSLKNKKLETSIVNIRTFTGPAKLGLFLGQSGYPAWFSYNGISYNEKDNINYRTSEGTMVNNIIAGYFIIDNQSITSLNPKSPFQAVDYNEFDSKMINLLSIMYPVGSIYIGTQSTCPMSAFFGTWTNVGTKLLTDVTGSNSVPVKGSGKTLGLTNGSINGGMVFCRNGYMSAYSNSYGTAVGTSGSNLISQTLASLGVTTDASNSGIVADISSSLTKSSLTVNIWQRTD